MKRIAFWWAVVGLLSVYSTTYGQGESLNFGSGKDSIICVENLAVYQHRYKNEERTGVFSPETMNAWRKAFNVCPQSSKNMYIPHGVNMFTVLYKNEKDAVKKQKYLDTIMMIYDKRIQNFGEENRYIGLKGADLILLNPAKFEEAYTLCKQSVDALGAKSDVKTLVMFMQAAVLKFENKSITKTEAIQVYQQIAAIFEANIQKGSQVHEKQLPVIENMFLQLKPECSDLVALFEPQFKANPENPELLKKIISNLGKTCKDSELYLNAVVSLDKIEPSALSKRSIAEMYVEKKQNNTALTYFKESIELEADNNQKAETYYRMASITMGSPSTSVAYAQSALKLDPNMGKAHLFIAAQYVNSISSCAEKAEFPEVARWTILWAAVDMCNKAKSVDPSVAGQANSQISNYRAHFPDAEALFGYNITEGSSHSYSCWFSVTTTAKVK
ncbi:MAG TPA: hypothetical protein PK734_01795 [Bacteroidales bacterium]|nr:MAG: hypothetical protein BWY22_00178 [Bacteroidetes bacterium ADurb.Bin217]HPM12202.1 hypothetical protein [Bacteroidales bacterium]